MFMTYQRAPWLLLMIGFFVLSDGSAAAAYGFVDDELTEARLDKVVEREPEKLEARYLRGICYGERGKHSTVESLLSDFLGKGSADFTFVLERDSLYRDVLYQYARLRHYADDYPAAIRLGHAQIRLKPDLAHAHFGLFKIYARFIVETQAD